MITKYIKCFEDLENLENLENEIISIVFDDGYNCSIEPLEHIKNLESITFGWNFDQPITPLKGMKNLKSIVFGWMFNQSIISLEGINSLENIQFGWEFDNELFILETLENLKCIKFMKCPTSSFSLPNDSVILETYIDCGPYYAMIDKLYRDFSNCIIKGEICVLDSSVEFRIDGIMLNPTHVIFKKNNNIIVVVDIDKVMYHHIEKWLLQGNTNIKKAINK